MEDLRTNGCPEYGFRVGYVSKEYLDILNSRRWRAIHYRVYGYFSGTCQLCGRPGNEVHHINRKHIGEEEKYPSCLTLLCPECHSRIHTYWNHLDDLREAERQGKLNYMDDLIGIDWEKGGK